MRILSIGHFAVNLNPSHLDGFTDHRIRCLKNSGRNLKIALGEDHARHFFGRVDILVVLDGVKKDRTLFPDAVVAMSDRIDAKKRAGAGTSPKGLEGRAHCKPLARD